MKTKKLFDNMSLYQRDRSANYYCNIYHNGRQYRKSMGTDNFEDAKRKCFDFQNELLTSPESPVFSTSDTFKHYADKLIEMQKQRPIPPSGLALHKRTLQLLKRKNGLLEYFGTRAITTIKRKDVDDFLLQLPLNETPLSTPTISKHLNILKQILDSAEVDIKMPKPRGRKGTSRGFFDIENYKKIRDTSKAIVGEQFKMENGHAVIVTEDLHDFIVFMMSSMLRPTVSEVYSIRHKDIKKKTEGKTEYLEFKCNRKNRTMTVQTLPTGAYVYRDICERVPDRKPSDYIILPYISNRRHAMKIMTRMFRYLLEKCELKFDEDGRALTPYSLRHSSITFNLMNPKTTPMQIARRADTSLKMIDQFYYPQSQLKTDIKDFLRII